MELEFSNKFIDFLSRFDKYGQDFKNITNTLKNFKWNTFVIKTIVSKLENKEVYDLQLFSKTNLKDIWNDIDDENKKLYSNLLNEVIDLGKLATLSTSNSEADIKIDNNDLLKVENILKQFMGKNINIEEISKKIIDLLSKELPNEINLIKQFFENEKSFIDDSIKKLSNINFDNILSNISIPKNKNGIQNIITDVFSKMSSQNPDFLVLFNQFNTKIQTLIKSVIKDDSDKDKYINILFKVLNLFDLPQGKFELLRQILKSVGITKSTKKNDKLSKEKRRRIARSKYRNKLRKKYKNNKN